ncbi:MAG: hypothetical protein PHX51_08555 [Clostridia bacterium]|nr:hypothetical protein [Clostridia bacterium]
MTVKKDNLPAPPTPDTNAITPLEALTGDFNNVTISGFGEVNFAQFKITEEMHIDLNKLDEECAVQPALYGKLSRVVSKAKYDAKIAKAETKKEYARCADFLRSPQGLAAQGKKATEA